MTTVTKKDKEGYLAIASLFLLEHLEIIPDEQQSNSMLAEAKNLALSIRDRDRPGMLQHAPLLYEAIKDRLRGDPNSGAGILFMLSLVDLGLLKREVKPEAMQANRNQLKQMRVKAFEDS